MSKDELWLRAQHFLALALLARERGELEFADELTARAVQLFEQANGITDGPDRPAPPPPSTSVVPQQQQQQQKRIEPTGDGEE